MKGVDLEFVLYTQSWHWSTIGKVWCNTNNSWSYYMSFEFSMILNYGKKVQVDHININSLWKYFDASPLGKTHSKHSKMAETIIGDRSYLYLDDDYESINKYTILWWMNKSSTADSFVFENLFQILRLCSQMLPW